MAISEHTSGSQTCTISTEHTLNGTTPETTDGIFQLVLDLNAAADGDVFEIRVKEKARSGDTQRTIECFVVANNVSTDSELWVSPAVVLLHGWDMTLKQTAGTGRAVPWSIRKVA